MAVVAVRIHREDDAFEDFDAEVLLARSSRVTAVTSSASARPS